MAMLLWAALGVIAGLRGAVLMVAGAVMIRIF